MCTGTVCYDVKDLSEDMHRKLAKAINAIMLSICIRNVVPMPIRKKEQVWHFIFVKPIDPNLNTEKGQSMSDTPTPRTHFETVVRPLENQS